MMRALGPPAAEKQEAAAAAAARGGECAEGGLPGRPSATSGPDWGWPAQGAAMARASFCSDSRTRRLNSKSIGQACECPRYLVGLCA